MSPTDFGFHRAGVSSSATTWTSAAARAAHSASGSASVARVVTSEQRNQIIYVSSTSMARHSATTTTSECSYTIDGEENTAEHAQDTTPSSSRPHSRFGGPLTRASRATEPGTWKPSPHGEVRAVDALWWIRRWLVLGVHLNAIPSRRQIAQGERGVCRGAPAARALLGVHRPSSTSRGRPRKRGRARMCATACSPACATRSVRRSRTAHRVVLPPALKSPLCRANTQC